MPTNSGHPLSNWLDKYDPNRNIAIGNWIEALVVPDREKVPVIIPDYMQPVGDSGWYISPDTPVDPQDCTRYPDSPWCGGNPITPIPLGVYPTKLESNICETCITVGSSLFFIALPQHEVCFRSKQPGCQPRPKPPDPPPIEGGPTAAPPIFTPFNGPRMYGSCILTAVFKVDRLGNDNPNFSDEVTFGVPFTYGTPDGAYTQDDGYGWRVALVGDFDGSGRSQSSDFTGSLYPTTWIYPGESIPRPTSPPELIRVEGATTGCSAAGPPPGSVPPPYRPPTPCPPCMCKCPNGQEQEDNNNELLLAIAKRLGVDDYPVTTPEWLVTNIGDNSKKHESITQLHIWMIQQLDALAGEFPVKVEIEDADPTEEGQQKKSIVLPNIAESLAEIYGLAAKTAIDSDIHTSFLMRLAAEAIAIKTGVLISQDYSSANASFLGYKGNQVKRKAQFAFNPVDQRSLETILNEAEFEYLGWRNEDRESVMDYLQKLMFSAGIIKTVFFRKKSEVERVLEDLKGFDKPKDTDEESPWKTFLRMINNPESAINKDAGVQPKIDDYTAESGGKP